MSTALLQLHGLRKQHGARCLLDIAELRIQPASAYVLTGMNGSGKSSLLRILCGLERAEIAQASYCGQNVRLTPYPPQLRREIVYVHQHPVMFRRSVAANIAYGLHARRDPHWQEKVAAALNWAGLSHISAQSAEFLSGGEKQRVALARARVLQARLLLLDEPTSNLDGAAREQVLALIPQLIQDGSSVLMVCHDRDLINLPGVQRWKLREGKLEYR